MAARYFVEPSIQGTQAQLSGAEAHHLAHVMRAKLGDVVTLFDGSGSEFSARVERLGRVEIGLEVLARNAVDRELSVPITLGVALPKGDRQRWLVEKAVELGVGRLVPLECERSNERPPVASSLKLRRAVIEAAKQCGRNRLMEIAESTSLVEFLDAAPRETARLIADPGAAADPSAIDRAIANMPGISIAIGPEGGFTPEEITHASADGWLVVGLGPRTLRVETAAITLVAALVTRLDRR